MTKITVLTEPLPGIKNNIKRKVKKVFRPLKRVLLNQKPFFINEKFAYGGHYAVTRSLVEGLQKINANYNYNPSRIKDVGEVVIVLTNIDALKQAIKWKKEGIIKKLLAGPNLMVFSNEFDNILSSKEIDICIVPSDWVRIAYEEDAPSLKGRVHVWYAGIDENYWFCLNNKKKYKALVYWKTETEDFCRTVEELVAKYGWEVIRVKSGSYKSYEFKEILSESIYAVFISRSESQGIALAETWAMNVPTFVWNSGKLNIEGREYSIVSSCPYLSSQTGYEWKTIEQLEQFLLNMENILSGFSPREWIVNNMTDKLSASNLLDLAGLK